MTVALDYIETVSTNIRVFLANKKHVFEFKMEKAQTDFEQFWNWVGAKGDRANALAEWEVRHNASSESNSSLTEAGKKISAICRKFPIIGSR